MTNLDLSLVTRERRTAGATWAENSGSPSTCLQEHAAASHRDVGFARK